MDIAAGLIKLNPNSSELVKKWKETIESQRTAAIQTLIDEGVVVESWFEIDIEGIPHLLWYMRKVPGVKFHEVYEKSTHEIDQFHAEVMAKISANHYVGKPLLDLQNAPITQK